MILAGIAGFIAYRLFKVETERDEKREQDALQQQANSIGVWTDDQKLIVANLSGLPIYDVLVSYRIDTSLNGRDGIGFDMLDAFSELTSALERLSATAVRPGELHEFRLPEINWEDVIKVVETRGWKASGSNSKFLIAFQRADGSRASISIVYSAVFMDNARRFWSRTADGHIECLND